MTGYKKLTVENWAMADPTSTPFVQQSVLALRPLEMSGDDWARKFLAIDLADHVPEEICELFSLARATALYGWFYYPLYRLGEEQLYRVLEAAVKLRCKQDSKGERRLSFKAAADQLIKVGVIRHKDLERWNATRRLRNRASHPERVTGMPPGQVLRMFEAAVLDINGIFAP